MNWLNNLASFSLNIGRWFGVPIYVHWTWFALVGVMACVSLSTFLMLLGIFAIILLHEFGHAFAMKRCGSLVQGVVIYPMGGVARGEIPSENEFTITVAGPLVNLFLVPFLYSLSVYGGASSGYFNDLQITNLSLLVFNLIPMYPLDGGRLLRSILAKHFTLYKATSIAFKVTCVCSCLLAVIGVMTMHLLLVVIAAFVYYSADQEMKYMERLSTDNVMGVIQDSHRLVHDIEERLQRIQENR